jgi:hypothetical protein
MLQVAHATMDLLKAQGVDGRRINYNEAPNYQSQVLKMDGVGKQKMARLPGDSPPPMLLWLRVYEGQNRTYEAYS